jgi:hypothetical protein
MEEEKKEDENPSSSETDQAKGDATEEDPEED